MDFVRGPVLRGVSEAEASFPDEGDRHEIGMRVADTLARIHAVDPDAVGLGDLGRKEDYVARQLRRWYGQWEKSKTRELASIDRVHDRLAARIPAQAGRLDRPRRLSPRQHDPHRLRRGRGGGRLGALHARRPARRRRHPDGLLARARRPGGLARHARQPGARLPHPRRSSTARYAEASGRDLTDLDFYTALGYWKLAIILEGVYARYSAGGYGNFELNRGLEEFARLVERLAETADEIESRG